MIRSLHNVNAFDRVRLAVGFAMFLCHLRWLAPVLLTMLLGCTLEPPHPAKTELMKRLEADGAGDLSSPAITKEALYAWLRKRPAPYNKDLQTMCADTVAKGVTVAWHESVDGKICAAARSIMLPPERQYDPTTFKGGNR